MTMKQVCHIFCALSLLLMSSCSDRLELVENNENDVMKLVFSPVGMGSHIVNTKATDKTAAEAEIHNLHVFFFDSDSHQYLTPSVSSAADEGKSYRYLEGGETSMLIDGAQFENASSVNIYVLANLKQDIFEMKDGVPVEIPDENALLSYEYIPYGENEQTLLGSFPETGLPMFGRTMVPQNFNEQGSKVIEIQMKSLMSRVDFNLSLNPPVDDIENGYPILNITGIQLVNVPNGAALISDESESGMSDGSEIAVLNSDIRKVTINLTPGASSSEHSFSFYMFEHLRETNGKTIDGSIQDEYKQRYKPTLAKDDAAYVHLTGRYTDKNAHTSNIAYTLYLGENAIDDFNITRNCKYVNNISVRGITAINHPDNPDEVIGLDTRVTMSRETNDYYYTILRERNHDAHFNVTPMDVYLPGKGSLKFTVPESARGWIWMDPIGREAESEGDGKASYFYTDMQSWLKEQDVSQDNTAVYTMVNNSDIMKVERIYFYLDENPSLSDREADISIYYESSSGTSSSQTLTLGQKGLMTTTINDAGTHKTVYMEQYEEYLNYYDPLAPYDSEQRYEEGLPWGNNEEIGSDKGAIFGVSQGTDCSQNYTMGNTFTPIIAKHNEQGKMTLNDLPNSAAAYCLNKNKRNRNGEVEDVIWYLPGIREIEQMLLYSYTASADFQENYYWSSAAGEEEGFRVSTVFNTFNEDLSRARATRVRHYPGGQDNPNAPNNVNWEGEYAYEKSGIDEPGWQYRSQKNRVRCMRISNGLQ